MPEVLVEAEENDEDNLQVVRNINRVLNFETTDFQQAADESSMCIRGEIEQQEPELRPSAITEGAFSGNRVVISDEIMQIGGHGHNPESGQNMINNAEQNYATNLDGQDEINTFLETITNLEALDLKFKED